jgi:hypothetical protein
MSEYLQMSINGSGEINYTSNLSDYYKEYGLLDTFGYICLGILHGIGLFTS